MADKKCEHKDTEDQWSSEGTQTRTDVDGNPYELEIKRVKVVCKSCNAVLTSGSTE